MICELMKQQNMTKYRLSQKSGIPYMTINDICNGKTQLEKCNAETVYKLAKTFNVSMESLLEPCFNKRNNFELYKSNVCHRLKKIGDIEFIIETLEQDNIRDYYNRKWYPECLYLLAMLDYISRLNDVPLCEEYNDIRSCKLEKIIYPSSVLSMAMASKTEECKEEAVRSSIPEFIRFNIVESEVRNVV